MSSSQTSEIHPDEWVEKKINRGKERLARYRDDLEMAVIDHPLRSIAIGAAAGYLARGIPLARTMGASVRLVVPLLPPLLLLIGAARAWKFIEDDRVRPARRSRIEPAERLTRPPEGGFSGEIH